MHACAIDEGDFPVALAENYYRAYKLAELDFRLCVWHTADVHAYRERQRERRREREQRRQRRRELALEPVEE